MPRLLPLGFLAILLAACGSEATPQAEASTNQPEEGAATPAVTPAQAARRGFESAYSETAEAGCITIEENADEAGWVVQRCPGFGGIDAYIKEGDLRQDVDAGVTTAFETEGPFNHVGGKIEWRHKRDGKPFAIIYRLTADGDMANGENWLIAESIGTAGKPGCRIARIDGRQPDANEKARAAADRLAEGPQPCLGSGP